MPHLAIGHAAALKPAVKHVIDAPQHSLAVAAGDCDVINEVPMEVSHLGSKAKHSNQSQQVAFCSQIKRDALDDLRPS